MGTRTRIFILLTLGGLAVATMHAQLRDFVIHNRGMLHETIYNTGEIGRSYDQGNSGTVQGIPSFEWPGNSTVIVDGVRYNGHNNALGGGMYLTASPTDTVARIYAYCGAVGSSSPEAVAGVHSFPLLLTRTENYPVLADGTLNPSFNPNEAEEIIVSKWASTTGLTVTRTSRAWSHPDYDDFIIYEYEIEHTGDRNGVPGAESTAELRDVLISFAWGFVPSQFGYQRTYNQWRYTDFEANDLRRRFDRNRWLNYGLDRNGKPDPTYFTDWASNNRYGGGLLSPQAVGFAMLYYDTLLLASPDETALLHSQSDSALVWSNDRLKQPFLNRLETSNLRSAKVQDYLDVSQSRKNSPYRNATVFGDDWVGRGSFNLRQSKKSAVGSIVSFGPYTIPYGAKLRFSLAQVAGYGAARLSQTQAGLMDEGGSCGEMCGETYPVPYTFFPVPNWEQPTVFGLDNATHGSNYLSNYPLPQYVNSNTVTIREVTDRAIEAYTGNAYTSYDTLQYRPELAPDRGVYQLPITIPAPAVEVSSNDLAQNVVAFKTEIESFTSPRLIAPLSHYEVFKSNHPLGPWTKLDSVGIGDTRYFANGEYRVIDANTRVGESFYYSLVSVDALGNSSGRTNLTLHETQIGGTETLETVFVVPNPFVVRSGFTGVTSTGTDAAGKIGFYNLPKLCTIRVFSYSGQLVQTIEHDSGLYSTEYLQVTRNNQLLASGVYFYVVDTPDGKRNHGKFVIIH